MPVVISPSVPTGTPVTSTPDGYLTCIPDPATGSVLLRTDFRGVPSGSPDHVSVQRRLVGTGPWVPVLGYTNRLSPLGYTAGIDHDAQLGKAYTYRAIAESAAGGRWVSGMVAVVTPSPTVKGWLKSSTTPALSVQVDVLAYPDWTYPQPQGVFTPIGARFPTVVDGVRRAGTGQITVGSVTAAVVALLNSPGPYLLQPDVYQAYRPDVWVRAGDLSGSFSQTSDPWTDWSFGVVEVARPDPQLPVSVPGHSFAEVAARYGALSAYPTPLIRLLTD